MGSACVVEMTIPCVASTALSTYKFGQIVQEKLKKKSPEAKYQKVLLPPIRNSKSESSKS